MFSWVYWNQPVCPSMYPSVYKILVSVKALAGLLTLSQTTHFRLFKTQSLQMTILNLMKVAESFPDV